MAQELIATEAAQDVAATVELLTAALRARDVRLFATIDHAAGAREAGLELEDEVLLVFGSPAVGTALMAADPRAGIDLPLRMLVWSRDGVTRVGHQDPLLLADQYSLGAHLGTLEKLRGLLEQLTAEVAVHPWPHASPDRSCSRRRGTPATEPLPRSIGLWESAVRPTIHVRTVDG